MDIQKRNNEKNIDVSSHKITVIDCLNFLEFDFLYVMQ